MFGTAGIIQILEIGVLFVSILAIGRIFFLVGDVQKTLAGIESTRTEITTTLQKVETVASTTEKLMREELTPTVRVARETLANLEVTSKALAESTAIVRKVAGSVENVHHYISMSGPIAQTLIKKASGAAGGLLSGISHGIKSIMGHKSDSSKSSGKVVRASEVNVAIPASVNTNVVLRADMKEPEMVLVAEKSRK